MLTAILFYVLCGVRLVSSRGRRRPRMTGASDFTGNPYPYIATVQSQYRVIGGRTSQLLPGRPCTGSLVDVWGTIMTCSRCMRPWETWRYENNTVIQVSLEMVDVTWGSYNSSIYAFERVPFDENRIVYHPHSYVMHTNAMEIDVSVALIFLETYRTARAINCQNDPEKPATLDRRRSLTFPLPAGTVVGFTDFTDPGHAFNFNEWRHAKHLEMQFMEKSYSTTRGSAILTGDPGFLVWSFLAGYGGRYIKEFSTHTNGLCSTDMGAPYVSNGVVIGMLRDIKSGKERCSKLYQVSDFQIIAMVYEWINGTIEQRYNQFQTC